MFFDNWNGIVRLIVITPLAYACLLFFLRLSGNRTLSKLNAFDLVVTVALGSSLATVVLSKQVPLAEGALALALLIALQYVVAETIVHSSIARRWLKGEAILVFHRGKFLRDSMRAARLTESDLVAVMRNQGCRSFEQVDAVVLETDGRLSVIKCNDSVELDENSFLNLSESPVADAETEQRQSPKNT